MRLTPDTNAAGNGYQKIANSGGTELDALPAVGVGVNLQLTFTLDTSAYATGDTLAETQELASALRQADGTGLLQSIVLNDKDDQGAALDIVILRENRTLGSENSAVAISDAHADDILGVISVTAGDWVDLGGCKVANLRNLALPIKANSGGTSIYVGLVTRGSPTHSASGITARFGILQD